MKTSLHSNEYVDRSIWVHVSTYLYKCASYTHVYASTFLQITYTTSMHLDVFIQARMYVWTYVCMHAHALRV